MEIMSHKTSAWELESNALFVKVLSSVWCHVHVPLLRGTPA